MVTFAELNAAHRRNALKWVAAKPLGTLILMRLVMEPLRILLQHQLSIAGEEWERKQRANLLAAVGPGGGPAVDRDYPICVAALGDLEREFFVHILALLQLPRM